MPSARLSCRILALVMLILGGAGCRESQYYNSKIEPYTEMVMKHGMVITVTNRHGTLRIRAKEGTVRQLSWDGASRDVTLMVRKERWHGSFGLYLPGDVSFRIHNGISRAVVDEGQMHFTSSQDAIQWLTEPFYRDSLDLVYLANGLAVGWMKVPARRQLSVEVWQIYVNGRKPVGLAGARNDLINVVEEEVR